MLVINLPPVQIGPTPKRNGGKNRNPNMMLKNNRQILTEQVFPTGPDVKGLMYKLSKSEVVVDLKGGKVRVI